MDPTKKLAESLQISEKRFVNILLLGETGVGKSTLINSIANYFYFEDIEVASKEELQIPIPAVINVTDKNFKSITIKIGSDKNEFQEVGAAATQDVKTYVLQIGRKTSLRLIDSPGMGDPRGIAQDDINCDNILAYLAQLKELHAICFLMKPTNTRLTAYFEYCINQILTRLEKSASDNIIFIFTNSRGTDYTPGDTYPCLEKVVEEIKIKPPHVRIPLSRENVFCLDNEPIKYLVAVKKGVELNESFVKGCIKSWNHSTAECRRLMTYILGDDGRSPLTPHQIQDTISVNEARRLVVQLSRPLADISQLIADNLRILDRHRDNLKIENQSLKELKKKMYIPIIKLEVTQLRHPVTVCTSTKCAEVVKVAEVNKWHYIQRCHDPCSLTGVKKELVGDPQLLGCAAMNGQRNCSICFCDYLEHMHVYYMTKTVADKIVDNTVKKNVEEKEAALQAVEDLVVTIDRRKSELEKERETITRSTAQFAHFLRNNSICPFSDSYKAYIEYLIQREKSLGPDAADNIAIENLEKQLRQYEEIKATFENKMTLSNPLGSDLSPTTITAQNINKSINKLYKLKHNGKKIFELMEQQGGARKSEYEQSCEYVHFRKTEIGRGKKKKQQTKGGKK